MTTTGTERPGMTVEDRVSGRPSAENSPALDRTAELGEVLALLADRDVRLVTVVGSPGAGKSWLAARVLAAWTGLTVSASLAHVTDAGLAADEVLASLEIGDGFASTPGHALWLAADGAPALLLLDDADDVADLAPLIEAMLATYPALTVLVTSSRALHVVGERTVVVRPLGDLGSEDPRSNAALALFVQRAAEIDPTFRLDAATTASAAAVCRAVGGLPLAVELAAARIRTVPLAVMAAQLESAAGLALLRRDEALGADSPDRRSSVEAAVDWSMSGLTSAASDLLVQLSVFQGPFDLDAAVAVARPTTPAPELLDRLSELVDAHLVALDPADPESAAFAVAPLVRRRASALLRGASVESEVRDAHAGYWIRACRTDPTAVRRHPADVLAALDRSISAGRLQEAMQLLQPAGQELMAAPGFEASLLPLVEEALDAGEVDDEALAARTLMWATAHAAPEEQSPQAFGEWTRQRVQRSISLARSSGDGAALLGALENAVATLGVTFDMAGALAAVEEGHTLAVQLGDERALARFEVWMSMAAGLRGDAEAAAQLARLAYERGLRSDEPIATCYAASILHRFPPDLHGPVPVLPPDELLVMAERIRSSTLVMEVLSLMVGGALARGDADAALEPLARMLLVAEDVERVQPMSAVPCLMLGVPVALARGQVEDAVRMRVCLAPLEQLLPQIIPSLAPGYLAAVSPLRDLVGASRYDEVAAEVAGLPLPRANRLAQGIVRSYRAASAPPAGVVAPGGATSSPADPLRAVGEGADRGARRPVEALTPREVEVLGRLVAGGTNREIAVELGVSTKTVMHHTMAIYRKLGVRGRAEAVAWALRSGTITAD